MKENLPYFFRALSKAKERKAGEDGSDKQRFPYSSRVSLPVPLGAMVLHTAVTESRSCNRTIRKGSSTNEQGIAKQSISPPHSSTLC